MSEKLCAKCRPNRSGFFLVFVRVYDAVVSEASGDTKQTKMGLFVLQLCVFLYMGGLSRLVRPGTQVKYVWCGYRGLGFLHFGIHPGGVLMHTEIMALCLYLK